MGIYSGPNIIEDGLVLHLDAKNKKSYLGTGTTWTDLSGRVNNGTLINGVGYNSANGGTLVFDGVNDYITCPPSPNWAIGSSGTLDMWVYATGSITTNHRLWCTNNNASSLDCFIALSNGTLGFHGGTFFTTSVFPYNTWVNLVTVYNSGVPSVYWNSVSQSLTGNLSGYTITNSNTLYIGQYAGGGNYYLNGRISNFKIYNRSLTPQEVRKNFNATRGRFGI